MKQSSNLDAKALDQFKDLGVNLDKEQEVEFFFYFPREYNAYLVAVELANLRFHTNINFSDPDQWVCLATKTMKPTAERLQDLREWMEELAERNDGDYDGWGTGMILDDKN